MLLKNIDLLDEAFVYHQNRYVGIEGKRIDYVGKQPPKSNMGAYMTERTKCCCPDWLTHIRMHR